MFPLIRLHWSKAFQKYDMERNRFGVAIKKLPWFLLVILFIKRWAGNSALTNHHV